MGRFSNTEEKEKSASFHGFILCYPFVSSHSLHVIWESWSLCILGRAPLFLSLYNCGLAQSMCPQCPTFWGPGFSHSSANSGDPQLLSFLVKFPIGWQYALTSLLELPPLGNKSRTTLKLWPQWLPCLLPGLVLKGRATCMHVIFLFRVEVSSQIWVAKVWWLRMGLVMTQMATRDEQENSDTQICKHDSLQTTFSSCFSCLVPLPWFPQENVTLTFPLDLRILNGPW